MLNPVIPDSVIPDSIRDPFCSFAYSLSSTQRWIPDQVRDDRAQDDRVRDDRVQHNGDGLDDGGSIGEQLDGFNIPTNPHHQFLFT